MKRLVLLLCLLIGPVWAAVGPATKEELLADSDLQAIGVPL